MHKDQIAQAALKVLCQNGLDRWTVADVAQEAECAKGLVHYHHQTKEQLLAAVADQLVSKRCSDRVGALAVGGTSALDDLWDTLTDAVSSGETRAWSSLMGHSSEMVRHACRLPDEYLTDLAAAIGAAFEFQAEEPAARSQDAAMDGFEAALLRGEDPERVHEAFHQTWLSVLS